MQLVMQNQGHQERDADDCSTGAALLTAQYISLGEEWGKPSEESRVHLLKHLSPGGP